jgi:glutathione synthase/RimK-type ligase-like ATP-grasp enzyme
MLHIYPYNENSESARNLSQSLNIRRIRQNNSRYIGRPNRTVINWGSSQLPENVLRSRVLNNPNVVRELSNKIGFFRFCGPTDVRIPQWTTSYDEIVSIRHENRRRSPIVVVERHVLNSHSGNGIRIVNSDEVIQRAPLYTVYIPKKAEYRVHFGDKQIIDIQRKIRDPNREPLDWRVRSHDNGFIYVRGNVQNEIPQDVIDQAMNFINISPLDFGAIDIIWNESQGAAYVLEVNTAPGITGETVNSYAEYFRQFI